MWFNLQNEDKQEATVHFSIGDNEQRLSKQLHSGNPAAMRELYARYGGLMMATIVRYVGNETDAQDVLQETLIKIFSHIDDFTWRGSGSLKAWALRLAVNQSISFLRERKKTAAVDLRWDVPDTAEEEQPDTTDVPPEVLQRLIAQLPDGYRTVFNLYLFEGLSHEQIAEQLGIKRDSSASQLHRAKALLAKQITDYRRQKETEQ